MQHLATESLVSSGAKTILSVAPQLPTQNSLAQELKDAAHAQERGYFLPDEDERVRSQFANYLRIRAALKSLITELTPLLVGRRTVPSDRQPEVFVVAFAAACLLYRSGRFILDNFRDKRVVWKKLDEAEPKYGVPRKQFTQVYRSITSPRNVMLFRSGLKFAEDHEADLTVLDDHPELGPVVDLLRNEIAMAEASLRYYAKGRLRYRWHSFLRRHHSGFKNVMFSIFRVSGSLIAEMRDMERDKRVTPAIRAQAGELLQPGDVIITRHDDATSNLFLPGFWPHGALYIGTPAERAELGVELDAERLARSEGDVCVLEARKDGVLFRELSDTLAVDCFTIIRPKLGREEIRQGLSKAITHEGKDYDFEFDFRRSDKLVCTEVTYRAYHGIGEFQFELKQRAGRLCLSAEDLLDQAVDGTRFEVIAVFGADGDQFVTGPEARAALIASYQK